MQGVKEKALELLASGKAQRVLGWKTGEFFYDLTPGVFESAEEVEREFEYGVFAGANLSKYCIAESKKDGVTAVFLKPCDTYSFVQLLKEYKVKREKVYIVGVQCDGMCDMEKIKETGLAGVTAVEEYELFDIVHFSGGCDEVFDKYFAAMGIAKPRIDRMSGYTSWYNYFQKIDENIILRDLNALDPVKESVTVFQVDDGYETFVGDWLDHNEAKFPGGMKNIAEKIHEKGYKAGIWLAPFNLQRVSRTYKEHPDWVIKEHGLPQLGVYGWGGAYTMDLYNNEAREYIRHFFDVILNDWGYDMVKLDFLYSQCITPRRGKSRGTIMCEAMEFLRECCGDKLILGCGVPLGAAFGYVDACRISCDVDLTYSGKYYNRLRVNNEIPSAQNAINNSVFRRQLNGRAFCNDPDVFFLRYSNLEFSREQKLLLGGINHLFGSVLFVSDNAEEYKTEDIEAIKIFFARPDAEILSVDEENDVFLIKAVIGGERKSIAFNIKTGRSNIAEVLGVK